MLITNRIAEINKELQRLCLLPMDDFIASKYMADFEKLCDERDVLERILCPIIDHSCEANFLRMTNQLESFNTLQHLN